MNFAAAAFGYGMDGLPILRAPPKSSSATARDKKATGPQCGNLPLRALGLAGCDALLLYACRTDFYALIRQILQCDCFNKNAVPLNGKFNLKASRINDV